MGAVPAGAVPVGGGGRQRVGRRRPGPACRHVSWPLVGKEQHRGRQSLGVGQQHLALLGLEPHVGEADIDDDALDLAGQGSGPEPDVVTDPERPGEEQHEPGEQVSQRLLCRDAQQDAERRPR